MIEFTNVPKLKVYPRMGWYADPSNTKDWQLGSTVFATAGTISAESDLSIYFRPISDQMQFASCTANATVDCWEAQTVMTKIASGMTLPSAISSTPDLSRMFAWWNGRNAMQPVQTNKDAGCYNRLVMDSVARFGIPTEETWPYITQNVTRRPSLKSYREARMHTCEAYYSIGDKGPDRIQLIIRALSNKRPVVFGTLVDDAFFNLETGTIWALNGDIVGGHAMVVVGHSLEMKAFKIRNSWSEYWGEAGYCWISEEHMQSEYCSSFWVPSRNLL
jgi:C1A family cysteine protease